MDRGDLVMYVDDKTVEATKEWVLRFSSLCYDHKRLTYKVTDDFGDAGSRTTVRRKRSFGRLGDISCSRDES